jgi:hypothetical protein
MRTIRTLAIAAVICTLAACGSTPTSPTAAAPVSTHRDGTATPPDCTDITGTMGSGNATGCQTSATTGGQDITGTMGSGN